MRSLVCAHVTHARTQVSISLSLEKGWMENMRASPLEYVSMGTPVERGGPYPPYIHPVFLTPPPLASIRSTIVRFLYFPRLPPLYSGTRDPTVHYPTVPPPHSSLSLCVWPTLGLVYERIVVRVRGHQRGRGKRENENSSRVRTYTCLLVFNSKERSARME